MSNVGIFPRSVRPDLAEFNLEQDCDSYTLSNRMHKRQYRMK